MSDDQLRESVRSLTSEQREAFDIVFSWCRSRQYEKFEQFEAKSSETNLPLAKWRWRVWQKFLD